jgi:uncharacterized protein (DUF736 family)
MGMQAKKVVQTELDPSTYARLRHYAEKRQLPLKTVVREALAAFVEQKEGPVDEDPIFRIVGRGKLKGRGWSQRKDWRP